MRPLLLSVFTLVVFSSVFAQGGPAAQIDLNGAKYEYLVVSFGKTPFLGPIESKATGHSKVLIYSPAGLQLPDESVTTQAQMDTLGKFGWELTAVVGAIGGDQEMVFKRVYDPQRAANEARLIAQEAKELADKEQQDRAAKEAESKSATPKGPIDLDEVDAAQAESAYVEKVTKMIHDGAPIALGSGATLDQIEVNVTAPNYNGAKHTIDATITIDGTAKLLKENFYRSSEARSLAQIYAQALQIATGISPDDAFLEISVNVIVKSGGKSWPVGSGFLVK